MVAFKPLLNFYLGLKECRQSIEKLGRRPNKKLVRCSVTLSNPQVSICLHPFFPNEVPVVFVQ